MCEREERSKRTTRRRESEKKDKGEILAGKRPEPHLTPRERNEREGGPALVKYKRRGCIYTFVKLRFIQLWQSYAYAPTHTHTHTQDMMGITLGLPPFWGNTCPMCGIHVVSALYRWGGNIEAL